MTRLKIIKSTTVTDAILTATDVPESEYSAWASGTTYALDARVYLASTHKVYQSLQAANTAKDPATEGLWWVEVEPTNRWKLFDLSTTSQTQITGNSYYELTPGRAVNAVALLNFSGLVSVRVRLTDPSFGVVYDHTTAIRKSISSPSWYAWFFEPRTELTQIILSDLPSYPNAVLRIDFECPSAAIGVCIFGSQSDIGMGGAEYGLRLGIQDYSRKERNDWGDTVLVQRAYAKRCSFNLPIENSELDATYALLSSLRATPCLWMVSDQYQSLVLFGFYNNFEITISYSQYSDCSLDLESLT